MTKKKKGRRRWLDEEKDAAVRRVLAAWAQTPEADFQNLAVGVGVNDSQLRQWMDKFGPAYGWPGGVHELRASLREPEARAALQARVKASALGTEPAESGEDDTDDEGAPEASALDEAAEPSTKAGPDPGWLAKHGEQLRLLVGATEPKTEREPQPAERTLLSRPEPVEEEDEESRPAPRDEVRVVRDAPRFEPRRVFLQRPSEREQPEDFRERALGQALRERDALMVALRILLREDGQNGS